MDREVRGALRDLGLVVPKDDGTKAYENVVAGSRAPGRGRRVGQRGLKTRWVIPGRPSLGEFRSRKDAQKARAPQDPEPSLQEVMVL